MLSITCLLSLHHAVYALEFAPTPELALRACARVYVYARLPGAYTDRDSTLHHWFSVAKCMYTRTLQCLSLYYHVRIVVSMCRCVRGRVQVRKGHARTVVQQVRGDEQALDDYLY